MEQILMYCHKCQGYYWWGSGCGNCHGISVKKAMRVYGCVIKHTADPVDVDFVIYDALRKLHEEPTCK